MKCQLLEPRDEQAPPDRRTHATPDTSGNTAVIADVSQSETTVRYVASSATSISNSMCMVVGIADGPS